MTTQAKRDANARYDKTSTRQLKLKLNEYTDADVLRWLDSQPNKQGAVKRLIRDEIARCGVSPTSETAAPEMPSQGLAGWYGWARVLDRDGHGARDVERKRFATETEAIQHARNVVHRLKESGADAYELWEECDRDGVPVDLA